MGRRATTVYLIEFVALPRSSPEMMDAKGGISVPMFRRDYLLPMQRDGNLIRKGTGRSAMDVYGHVSERMQRKSVSRMASFIASNSL